MSRARAAATLTTVSISGTSGTLTVYGADCQPRHFGPGELYIGGDTSHLARNEGNAPVEMAVTFLVRPGQSMGHLGVPHLANLGCSVE
jgi:hypothetical protein